ncbi:hypothetical protein BurJ1DRAFT_1544 [Burkholderiales bacterium JOSHI_001]|nr:hypothetical protein BurJ1DRAFT_1544 [Burkholderiales bacterium JOSHI_001]
MNIPSPGLSLADLEAVYDRLALAIDQAGEARAPLMLSKLALLLAQELGDGARFDALLQQALADL